MDSGQPGDTASKVHPRHFATTHWSLVLNAATGDGAAADPQKGRWRSGPRLEQAESFRAEVWATPDNPAALSWLELDSADVWILPVPTTGASGWSRMP